MSNEEILDLYLSNGLIQKCLDMQFMKLNDKWRQQFKEDLYQDLIIVILEYDNDKLNDVHNNNHMNAWLTRIIQNQIYSNTSNFYHSYVKFPHRVIFDLERYKEINEEKLAENEED